MPVNPEETRARSLDHHGDMIMDRISRSSKLASPRIEDNGDRLFNRREAAALLGVSLRWLESRKDIPAVNLASAVSRRAMPRYRESDLRAFIATRAAHSAVGRS